MDTCPCGSKRPYKECCGPYISGEKKAPTAEALMRSRYTAYTTHAVDYIISTCTSGKNEDIDREQTKRWSEKSTWLGLEILSTTKGGPADDCGTVEFTAAYILDGLKDKHREKANFKKIDGTWLYDDGEIIPTTIVRAAPKTGRNESCPCGSGKKYKHCCGKGA